MAGEVSVVVINSRTGEGVLALEPFLLPGRTVLLLGLSGAGKSTLVNLLVRAEVLATGRYVVAAAGVTGRLTGSWWCFPTEVF